MTQKARASFIYTNSPERHEQRRRALLSAYPEIKSLFGYESKTKYIATALVAAQCLLAFYTMSLGWVWWCAVLYCLGATISHSIFTIIHELTHHLGFKSRRANRLFALFCNLPLGIPMAMGFEKYHFAHHRFMGDAKKDTDIPFAKEAKWFNSRTGKLFWLLIQPFTYAIRPFLKWPQQISSWEWLNLIVQLLFNCLVVFLLGVSFLAFLVLSTLVSMSIHPTAAHTISEHIVMDEQQETYSYYGPMNYLLFHVGYHVEHHDFPAIPWSRIKQLKRIAPEYYESLFIHKSWIGFMVNFIVSKKINLFSRVVRQGTTHIDPTSRGLSAGSIDVARFVDPADKPRDAGIVGVYEQLPKVKMEVSP